HEAGDEPGEQERLPVVSLPYGQPEEHEDNQREAEAEQRGALRHQVGAHRVQPLEVEVAIERVLAGQMREHADSAVHDIAGEVEEAQASAEQEDEHGDGGRATAACESRGGKVEHG